MSYTTKEKIDENGKRLPNRQGKFIIISNPNYDESNVFISDVNNDNYKTDDNLIFYGYFGEALHPLYLSETTVLLPINNASDISLKTKTGVTKEIIYTVIS